MFCLDCILYSSIHLFLTTIFCFGLNTTLFSSWSRLTPPPPLHSSTALWRWRVVSALLGERKKLHNTSSRCRGRWWNECDGIHHNLHLLHRIQLLWRRKRQGNFSHHHAPHKGMNKPPAQPTPYRSFSDEISQIPHRASTPLLPPSKWGCDQGNIRRSVVPFGGISLLNEVNGLFLLCPCYVTLNQWSNAKWKEESSDQAREDVLSPIFAQKKKQEFIPDHIISAGLALLCCKGLIANSHWSDLYAKPLLRQSWEFSSISDRHTCSVNKDVVQDSKDQMLIKLVHTMNSVYKQSVLRTQFKGRFFEIQKAKDVWSTSYKGDATSAFCRPQDRPRN